MMNGDGGRLHEDLVQRVSTGRLAVVVGTGVSISATGGHPNASWRGLLLDGVKACRSLDPTLDDKWADRVNADIKSIRMDDMLSAADRVHRCLTKSSGGAWSRWLRESIGSLEFTDTTLIKAIAALRTPLLTTNYDDALETALRRRAVTVRDVERLRLALVGESDDVIHLHGHWEVPDTVVLGAGSYDGVIRNELLALLSTAAALQRSLLFVGVGEGLSDPHFETLRSWLTRNARETELRHYRLCTDAELEPLSKLHAGEAIHPVSCGPDHQALIPFLTRLAGEAFEVSRSSSSGAEPVGDDGWPQDGDRPAERIRVALGVVVHDGHVALVRRLEVSADVVWGFPGGIVKPLADPGHALCTEVQEETGLVCAVARYLGQRIHPDTNVEVVYFLLRAIDGELINGDPSEHIDVRWVRVDKVYEYVEPEKVFEGVRQALEDA